MKLKTGRFYGAEFSWHLTTGGELCWVCVYVHKAEHTAAETACFVFSSRSIIQAISSCFCFLWPKSTGGWWACWEPLQIFRCPRFIGWSISLFLSENTQTLLYNYVSHQLLALNLKMDVWICIIFLCSSCTLELQKVLPTIKLWSSWL